MSGFSGVSPSSVKPLSLSQAFGGASILFGGIELGAGLGLRCLHYLENLEPLGPPLLVAVAQAWAEAAGAQTGGEHGAAQLAPRLREFPWISEARTRRRHPWLPRGPCSGSFVLRQPCPSQDPHTWDYVPRGPGPGRALDSVSVSDQWSVWGCRCLWPSQGVPGETVRLVPPCHVLAVHSLPRSWGVPCSVPRSPPVVRVSPWRGRPLGSLGHKRHPWG